jgi:phosphate transport system substrate-binding protein
MTRIPRLAAMTLALGLVAAACGDGGSTPASDGGGNRGGAVNISGSSTVEPISARVAEIFSAQNPGTSISVDGPGTGDGFALFCSGQTDISDASRPIKDSEAEECAANGISYIELNVAIDGLSVLTSNENDAFTCLGTADLYALLGEESIGFGKWSDANDLAAEIGAPNAPYPDADLRVTAPGEESGTFDTFVEFLIDGIAGGEDYAETRGASNVRPDYTASANDNTIIEGIAGSQYSLGWVGYAFFLSNQDKVQALAIDGDNSGNCVDPSPATIADGSYPFSRPLFIYVNADAAASKPEVAAYVDLYLSEEGLAAVDETGYVRLADYGDVSAKWEGRVTG